MQKTYDKKLIKCSLINYVHTDTQAYVTAINTTTRL